MNWYWRVRIYNTHGDYWHCQIVTPRNLQEIDAMQEFYKNLTGCKMLLEGMSETDDAKFACLQDAFDGLWVRKDVSLPRPE